MQPTKLYEQIAMRYQGGGITMSEAIRQVAEQGLPFSTPASAALFSELLSDVAQALGVVQDGRSTLVKLVDEAARENRSRKAIGDSLRKITAADYARLTETDKATAIAQAAKLTGIA